MDSEGIKRVLEAYFKGNSSLEQEKRLREYFLKNENVPAELEYARRLFLHLKIESEIAFTGSITSKSRYLGNRWIVRLSGIAAGILLLWGLWLIFEKPASPVVYAYINGKPVTDKTIALEEAQKALSMVSVNFRNGTRQLHQLSKFNEYGHVVIKTK
jgi:hypothetical protein